MPRWVESAPKNLRWARIETTARVRWSECDFQAHAYYGSYIPWCDLGREALGLAVGVDYQKYMFTTTEFHIRYHTSARYLDELVIKTWAATPHVRLDCYYEIYRKVGNQLLCEARSSHALVDPKAGLRMGGAMFHDQFEAYLNRQDAAAREAADGHREGVR
jgi:acyl-CoA thioester hydrolase